MVSPASVGRRDTLFRLGPVTPLAPGTAHRVWQLTQVLEVNSAAPVWGLPGTFGAGVSMIAAGAGVGKERTTAAGLAGRAHAPMVRVSATNTAAVHAKRTFARLGRHE